MKTNGSLSQNLVILTLSKTMGAMVCSGYGSLDGRAVRALLRKGLVSLNRRSDGCNHFLLTPAGLDFLKKLPDAAPAVELPYQVSEDQVKAATRTILARLYDDKAVS